MRKYIFLIISILWTLVILSFSTQSGETSGSISYNITFYIYNLFHSFLPNLEIDTLHLIIRKCAHIGEYAVLGIWYGITGYHFKIKGYYIIILGLVISLIDEGIQLLSIERGPSLIDALLFDFPGYLIGLFIIILLHKKNTKFDVS